MRFPRTIWTIVTALAVAGFVLGIVMIVSKIIRVDRQDPTDWLAVAGLALGLALTISSIIRAGRLRKAKTSMEKPESNPANSPSSDGFAVAADQQEKTSVAIEKLTGEGIRRELRRSLAELRAEHDRHEFRVVVFGTGSAGKTSLINALLGREVGETNPIMGTTKRGEIHTEVIRGLEGTLRLTDTPGLSEFGREGEAREREARELAEAADLILFVLDHDLIRAELDALIELADLKKRLIVIFNKTDRYTDQDRSAILAKLRERLHGKLAPEDVVTVAAAPRPIPVRVMQPDGSAEFHYEPEPSDLSQLEDQIARILEREGPALRAGNLLLRGRRLERKAADALVSERQARALAVIEKYQWVTAASVFASPTAAINLASGGAAQYQMLIELAQVFDVESSPSRSRAIVAQMMTTLLKLGIGEAATNLIAGLFKTSLFSFAAAGAVQAVTMAYLTRVSGLAFAEYFANEQSWGEGGIKGALLRQFDATSRTEFLQDFMKQAAHKLAERARFHKSSDQA